MLEDTKQTVVCDEMVQKDNMEAKSHSAEDIKQTVDSEDND